MGAVPATTMGLKVIEVFVLLSTVSAVGAGGLVVTLMAVDGADVPPAFVAVIVRLLNT